MILFSDLEFESRNSFTGLTKNRAVVELDNGYDVSVVSGTFYKINAGHYDVMGLIDGQVCTKILYGPKYTTDLPAYFESNERNCTPKRVMEIIEEVRNLPNVLIPE